MLGSFLLYVPPPSPWSYKCGAFVYLEALVAIQWSELGIGVRGLGVRPLGSGFGYLSNIPWS